MRTRNTSTLTTVMSAVIALAMAAWPVTGAAAESNWDQIKRTGKLRLGVFAYPPNHYIDTKTGKWEGFAVDMARDIASTMEVALDYGESSFGNAPLDLQANKIDIQFGLQATPKRAMAIDFAGPIYELNYIMINGKNFHGKTWEDYNKPEVKVAVKMGASSELAVRMYAPRAQRVELKEIADIIMAVQAGRADALGDMAIAGLVAKIRNPQLGEFVQPTPISGLPSYAGMRFDGDHRFRDFVTRWAEFHRLTGSVPKWIRKSLTSLDIKESDIPDDLRF